MALLWRLSAPPSFQALHQEQLGELADVPVRIRSRIGRNLHPAAKGDSGKVGRAQHLPDFLAPSAEIEPVHRARRLAVSEGVEGTTIFAPGEREVSLVQLGERLRLTSLERVERRPTLCISGGDE